MNTMSFLSIILFVGLIILGFMLIIWLVSLALKNSSIIDIFWGLGFVVVTWLYFFFTPNGVDARKWLISALVTIWGMRLSLYILWRNWAKPEDFRYQAWRREAGAGWWWRSFFRVFLLQGLLLWVISIPLLAAQYASQPSSLKLLDYLGLLIWLIGFFFESVGDLQLAHFKSNFANKGKVLDVGLWRYTRHPNYFGDSAQWWGFFLIAVSTGGWWVFLSPLIMTLLLLKVSGVTLLEKSLKGTKPQYKEYVEKTSAFFPSPPKKNID
jgi:steroid 5-alpha reductase family enzyme